ncbi:8160_t:CDS:2 [Gigaspora margarita]|uniref:8160_t:CDS:1 n=1 Tax=Gigaspora margarita TaxID=4874 RepID=A0ABN7UUC7_GIGMA|nr:8160_t:CDS:2 [Gigaspora margarita]
MVDVLVQISIHKPSKISYKSLKKSTSKKLSNIRKRLSTISSLDSGIGWLDESDNSDNEEFHHPIHNNNSPNTVGNSTNDTKNYDNFKFESTSSKQICDRENGSSMYTPLKPTDCVTSKFIEIIEIPPLNDKLTENENTYSFVPYHLTKPHNRTKNTLITTFNTLKPPSNVPSADTEDKITSNSSNSHCFEIEGKDQKTRNLVKSKGRRNIFENVKSRVKKFLTIKNNRKEKYEAKNQREKTNSYVSS